MPSRWKFDVLGPDKERKPRTPAQMALMWGGAAAVIVILYFVATAIT